MPHCVALAGRAIALNPGFCMTTEITTKPSRLAVFMQKGREHSRTVLRPVYRLLRRILRFVKWTIPALGNFLPFGRKTKRRILVIYDTTSQPFSVGDLLIFQGASLVLCMKHQADAVDFAIVFAPENPSASDPVFAGTVTEDNVLFHIASLLPLAQVNQKLGSFFVFNSHEHLHQLIADNSDRYHVWPSGWGVATREYLSPIVFNDLFRGHYKEHGSIPHLSCRPFLKEWAMNFYREFVFPQVPVTINIRNNKGWHLHRNSQMDSWLALFRYCEARYPAKFIVICARAEIDERLRECTNVILAKDHHTGVEQDMALIHSSAMHMGAGSGPASMAWFNDKPYLMVNTEYKAGEFFEHTGMIRQTEENIQQFWFAGPDQRIAGGAETPELLIREFELLWKSVDSGYLEKVEMNKPIGASTLQTWLR